MRVSVALAATLTLSTSTAALVLRVGGRPDRASPDQAVPARPVREAAGVVGPWYDERGKVLPDGLRPDTTLVVHVLRGRGHCDWESVEVMGVSWPPGTTVPGGGEFRQYVRDTRGALWSYFGNRRLAREFDHDADLPKDARGTGFHRGSWELWFSPADGDRFVYLVGPHRVERWVRSPEIFACR